MSGLTEGVTSIGPHPAKRTEAQARSDILCAEFTECLNTLSHVRAGMDYELTAEQKAKEHKAAMDAKARARAIWAEHPDHHVALRAAFVAANPLAMMSEIEVKP